MLFSKKKIITVASGKGGVGKSVIATNIAAGLALLNKKVIIADTDFGGANLHALLNVIPQGEGIKKLVSADIIPGKNGSLQETPIPNLSLIHGWDYLGVHGLNKEQFAKMNTYIEGLEADYVLLDLSPGIANYTLDLFNQSDIGIVVFTPEITSILNALVFIKFTLLKKMIKHAAHNKDVVDLITAAVSPSDPMTITEILDLTKRIDLDIWRFFNGYLKKFHPAVIINRVEEKDDMKVETEFNEYLERNYFIKPHILGWLKESSLIKDSVHKRVPVIIGDPSSDPAGCIKVILHKLLHSF